MKLDTLHNMDCIAGMEQISAGSIDMAFADPPFNIGYEYDVYEDKRAADEYLDWTRKWGGAMVKALKPTGTFWLAIGSFLRHGWRRQVPERGSRGNDPI